MGRCRSSHRLIKCPGSQGAKASWEPFTLLYWGRGGEAPTCSTLCRLAALPLVSSFPPSPAGRVITGLVVLLCAHGGGEGAWPEILLSLLWAGVVLQPCGMSKPGPRLPHVAMAWLPPGGVQDPRGGGSLGATHGPFGPLSRRTLQPALRVRHFCGEHTQLFRWICIGLLCTGEPGA